MTIQLLMASFSFVPAPASPIHIVRLPPRIVLICSHTASAPAVDQAAVRAVHTGHHGLGVGDHGQEHSGAGGRLGTFNITDYRWFNPRDTTSSKPAILPGPTFSSDGLLLANYARKPSLDVYRRLIRDR